MKNNIIQPNLNLGGGLNPTISIVIPTYKTGSYLEPCLQSIQEQSFQTNELEVLIILNGPKEPYWDSIREIIQKINLNIYLIYTESKGVCSARNIGLDLAKGQFVAFVDDDDILSSNYFEELHSKTTKDILACSDCIDFEDTIDNSTIGYLGRVFRNSRNSSLIENRRLFSTAWGKVLPVEIIKGTRFNETIRFGEDALFMVELSPRITQINLDNKAIYYRRLRSTSSTRIRVAFMVEFKNLLKIIRIYFGLIFRNLFNGMAWFIFLRFLAALKYSFARFFNMDFRN